ncbi:hypothetical protein DIPPA_32331 [Diplonema papillatum]|nr:hypothetical protein DIPPA_32331 [Diplonema papillatum]
MGSVYAQLAAYRNACGQPPSWATTVVLYVAAQMDRGLLPSTLLNYTNTAVSALRRVGVEVASDVLIVDLRRALGKMGARRPTRQAVPITEGDFWAAVEAEADEKVQLLQDRHFQQLPTEGVSVRQEVEQAVQAGPGAS